MKSKIHNATITEANVNYEGSITIDEDIMEKADMVVNEKVQVVNMNNGNRLETYVIKGKKGSKVICMNGPAALLCKKGERVHIISYALVDEKEAKQLTFFCENRLSPA
jgi:aspartate 1-decarboxylase